MGVRRVGPRAVALVISLAAGAFIAAPAAASASTAGTASAGTATATAATAARAASGTAAGSGQHGTGRARTVVTFAWGGGSVTQMQALPVFRHYGMHATFFIPSGLICTQSPAECARTSPYLTRPDLGKIAADGNEIGGLTVLHQQLNTVPPAEARREVCDDRSNLMRWGFQPTDFAYPFAVDNPATEQIARKCGYNAGLGAGDVRGAGLCLRCAAAETIPPANPMAVRAPIEVNSVNTRWSLHTFQLMVSDAQAHGGGWLVILDSRRVPADLCARHHHQRAWPGAGLAAQSAESWCERGDDAQGHRGSRAPGGGRPDAAEAAHRRRAERHPRCRGGWWVPGVLPGCQVRAEHSQLPLPAQRRPARHGG